jgi:hypothetical protein
MNGDHCLSNDLTRHLPLDFDAPRPDLARALNIGFTFDNYVSSAKPAGNSPGKINRRGVVTMQIAAQSAFYQGRPANHATAAQIAFGHEMHVAARSNRPAESAGDLIIAEIDMCAATGADRRRRGAADLLFPLTFEALDNRAALPFPKILKPVKDGRMLRRGRFFFYTQLQAGLRRKWRKVTAALAADGAFGRRILHLLEATVRAFHTDFSRRGRIGHWELSQDPSLSAPSKGRLDRFVMPHNFRAARRRLGRDCAAGDFRFANKSRSLFNDETRRFQISLQRALRF